jgi:hypothetical protein
LFLKLNQIFTYSFKKDAASILNAKKKTQKILDVRLTFGVWFVACKNALIFQLNTNFIKKKYLAFD